jgi:predicted exporter
MRIVHDTLGARFGSARDTMLKSFVTIRSFVPDSADQDARLAILSRIRSELDNDFPKASRDQRSKLAALRRYTETTRIAFDSLPPYARHFLTESDGSHGKFGFLYGELRESDAVESRKFQDRYGSIHTALGEVPVASSGFIYADVVATVKGDIGRLAVAVFVLLGLVVSLDTRSWRGFLVNMGYIALIAVWTWGAMGWLGLKLGIFNIVVLPALLSNTVDATIHLYHRRMEAGAGKLGEIYNTAGSSVLAGTLTNAFGFLALVFVAHQGLNSIGILASLGYLAGIVLMFTAMPLLLEVLCPTLPEAGHSED